MFARHLMDAHPDQLWVQRLSARYHAFLPEDIIELCIMCHTEMHQLYLPYIRAITYQTARRVSQFSEMDVKNYKAQLSKLCLKRVKTGFTVRKSIVTLYYKEAAAREAVSRAATKALAAPPKR